MENNIKKLPPFINFCYTIGMIPTSYKDSLTYEEQLVWFCNFLEKEVIPAVNTTGQAVEELQNLFIQLKEYVDNYFENLDVQQEINNKLDEMALSGELAEIITAYLQLKGMLCFDSVADLKAAENLINGSVARTLGFYSVNDEGGALYTITDSVDVIPNEITSFALQNSLKAVINEDLTNINVLKLGFKNDGTTDNSSLISSYSSLINNGDVLYFPSGVYKFSEKIVITKPITLKGTSISGNVGTKLSFDGTSGIDLRATRINIENIDIYGTNKEDSIDIAEKDFGTIGIINNYTDSYTNSGTRIINCNIHGFNTGVAIYSTRELESNWSGDYRVFKDCVVSYNDIGYIILDGATYNSIVGGNITSNSKHGIYAETETYYQNIEIIDTAIEVNGSNNTFTDNAFVNFGIFVGNNTKLKLTNCYIEDVTGFVNNDGIIEMINCHVHSNVRLFGLGHINSINSHAPNKTEFKYSLDTTGRSTSANATLTAPFGDSAPYTRVQADTNSVVRFNLPNLIAIPYPVKEVEFLQFDCDFRVASGYELNTFSIRPEFDVVGYVANNSDGGNLSSTYCPKNIKINDNKWHHLTFFWKPRIGVSENEYLFNGEDLIYRISTYIFFANTISNGTSVDFSQYNLDAYFANCITTLHGKSKSSYDPDLTYLQTQIPTEE